MLCIWAYANSRVREFYLPDQRTWTEKLVLSRSDFGCPSDVVLSARELDGLCYLAAPEGSRFASSPEGCEIQIGDGVNETLICGGSAVGLVVRAISKGETRLMKYRAAAGSTITIGKSGHDTIFNDDPQTSRHHAAIAFDGGRAVFADTSSNGSYVNGRKALNSQHDLSFGDIIQIPTGLRIIWLDGMLAVNQPPTLKSVALEKAAAGSAIPEPDAPPSARIEFHRAPRLLSPPDTMAVEIESPVQKAAANRPPWFLQVGPSMTMAIPMAASVAVYSAAGMDSRTRVFSLVTVGFSSLLAIVWATANRQYQKRLEKRGEAKRRQVYGDYLRELDDKLGKRAQAECDRLLEQYPSPSRVFEIASGRRTRLWERMPGHPDFLRVRVGVGDVPFPAEIKIPRNRLSLMDDELRDYPETLQTKYRTLRNMPVSISLIDQAVFGLAGSDSVQEMLRSIVARLAATHSYTDVRIVILHGPGEKDRWQWARWLPHCYDSSDRKLRLIAGKPSDVDAVLSHVSEVFANRKDAAGEEGTPADLPRYVVCATHPKLIEDQPFLATLLGGAPGLTYIAAAPYMDQLPKECGLVFEADKESCSLYEMIGKRSPLTGEFMDPDCLERLARALAPMRVTETAINTAIPTSVTFLETYGVRRAEDLDIWRLWSENHVYDGMRSVVGLGAGGKPFALDLCENAHGPHGLVAGTTGSGKSVMLQTYILSLAVNYSPDEVQFLLIDYKGGGMTAPFVGLPHVSGILTNLDGGAIYRARVSLQAEVRRRQTLFAQAGVEKIDEYIRMREASQDMAPLAHLIIITDEFAELKSDQPDFMSNLISIARVGRSLGVHLILATQKPSNSVSDEIWANSRFKICLRVQDRADSSQMLHHPEAAYLKGAGRCYLQVGNDELFIQLQTSYSGAPYDPDMARADELAALLDDLGRPVPLAQPKRIVPRSARITEMEAVLARIEDVARSRDVNQAFQLWKEPLKEVLFLEDIEEYETSGFNGEGWPSSSDVSPVVGVMDDLRRQCQTPVRLPFADIGNVIVCGLTGAGKTTFLQTLALSAARMYSPARVQVYIFSLTTRTLGILKALPHVGDVVYQDEEAEIQRLVRMLDKENERRRALLAEAGTDSFAEYNRAMARKNAAPLPLWIIMVDRVQQAREDTFPDDTRRKLFTLMRETAGRGICFIVTAMGMNELPGNLHTSFTGIALQQSDKGAYREALGCVVQAEEASIPQLPGRGLFRMDGPHEFQTALYGAEQGDEARIGRIADAAHAMDDAWNGVRPRPIPRVPENIAQAEFLALPACSNPSPWRAPVGFDIEDGSPFHLPLDRDHSWLVFGARRGGKTGLLTQIARLYAGFGARIIAVGGGNAFASDPPGIERYSWSDKRLDEALRSVSVEINGTRTRGKAKAREEGGEPAVRAYAEKLQPIVILIDELDQMAGQGSEYALKFLPPTIGRAAMYGIYVFAALAHDSYQGCASKPLVKAFADTQRGILLGGRYGVGFASPWNLPRSAQRRESFQAGHGLLYMGDTVREIMVPSP